MDEYRDHIATVSEAGKRVWIFPKKPRGKFTNRRKVIAYLLLLFLFAAPHLRLNGEQLILFNVLERKFVFFGGIFWPQDFYIFAISLVLGVVFVILFTIIYGRIFCGWVCPQTIFMEFVFRKIEYWIDGDWNQQKALAKSPRSAKKIGKRVLKHTLFWLVSFAIANTFLAYVVGSDYLWKIQHDPLNKHLSGLISIFVFTSLFYFVFAHLREQVCTTICPYGRLQGVLLDPNSMVVAYDYVRGEDRAKFKKGEDRTTAQKGDCIDCAQCVHVCPTGIDIRNGTQLECINCTACIDACDTMMDGVGFEKGLIRFVSENGIKNRTRFQWTRRVKAYTILLAGLLIVLMTLLFNRKDFSTVILRQRGSTYQVTDTDEISNIFEIDLTNKTKSKFKITLQPAFSYTNIEIANNNLILKQEAHLKERFVVKVPYEKLTKGLLKMDVIILGNGHEIDRVQVKIIGPNY